MTVPVEAWPVPGVVQAPLNYRVKGDEKRVVYRPTPDAATSAPSGTFEWQTVSIADGRSVVGRLSLDGAGFELRPHDTAVSSFYDDEEVRTIYYPEVEQLVKAATGWTESRLPRHHFHASAETRLPHGVRHRLDRPR